jgi:putative cell wall-binding protein
VPRLLSLCLAALLMLSSLPGAAAAQEDPAADQTGLTGVVTDPDGQPVPEAVVTAVHADDVDEPVADTTTDTDGAWELALDDGEYHLHVAAERYADQWWDDRGEPVDVVTVGAERDDGDDAGDDEIVVELRAGARITGTVEGPDGPLEGAQVRVERTPFSIVVVETDADGEFMLTGLRGGTHAVVVDAGERFTTGFLEVEVDAGAVADTAYVLRPKPDGVERVAGADRVATAVAASRRGFTVAPTVVLADARSFPDALAAAPLAASVGGPLLLVGPRLTPTVLDELHRLGTQEVIVVGAIGAVPLIVSEELRRAGLEVRRIAGDSRFDTAALIARDIGASDGRAIVVSGWSFADALSVAPYAAAQRIPILLTGPDSIHPDTAEVLRELEVTETVVVGGSAVVSDEALGSLPAPTRVGGEDRYATSRAVAEFWAERDASFEVLHVATGRDYPDALAAGPVAGLSRGPLLLIDGLDPAVAEETYALVADRAEDIDGIYAFGGTAVLSDAVLERLRTALAAHDG